jgi:hypothetical protein
MTTEVTINTTTVDVTLAVASGPTITMQTTGASTLTVSPVGMQGPPGPGYIQTVTTAEAIGGGRAVTGAGLYPTTETLDLIIGITLGAAVSGAAASYIGSGVMEDSGWSWTPAMPIYAGALGVLTQTEPVGTLRRVATAVSATKITVDLQPTIHRS